MGTQKMKKNEKIRWYIAVGILIITDLSYLIWQAKAFFALQLTEKLEDAYWNLSTLVNIPIGANLFWYILFSFTFLTVFILVFRYLFIIEINNKLATRNFYENIYYHHPIISKRRLLIKSILSIILIILGSYIVSLMFNGLSVITILIISYIFGVITFFWIMIEEEAWESGVEKWEFREIRSISYFLKVRNIIVFFIGLVIFCESQNTLIEKLVVIFWGLVIVCLFLLFQRFCRIITLFIIDEAYHYNELIIFEEFLEPFSKYTDSRDLLRIIVAIFLVALFLMIIFLLIA